MVVAYRDKCFSNFTDIINLSSTHEEVDTKMIIHVISCSEKGANLNIHIVSPDTDVLVIATNKFPILSHKTRILARNHVFDLQATYDAIGENKCAGLPGFMHSLVLISPVHSIRRVRKLVGSYIIKDILI